MLTEMQIQLLKSKGYRFEEVVRLADGRYVARASKGVAVAAHLGTSPFEAVRRMIQMLLRP